ncbi:MAG TPA: hypothetical protein VFZ42_15565 [Chitinophagaceae bacterium]
MRNIITFFVLAVLVMTGIAFFTPKTAIVGKVNPADGAETVWLMGERDSLKTGVSDGQFFFEVKPGAYKLMVQARPPYKDAVLDNLVVKQEETLDVGEIILKQ